MNRNNRHTESAVSPPPDGVPGPHGRLGFVSGTLLLEGVPQVLVDRCGGAARWTWDPRVSAWRADALHYAEVRDSLKEHAATIDDTVPGWVSVACKSDNLHKLRPEQQDAYDAWMSMGRGVVVMPTGTGKTEVALAIMRTVGLSTLIVAPVRDLMYQWHRRILAAFGIDAGIIGDGVHRVSPVSVTTYDSAFIHMDRIGSRFALVIFDECHHLPGRLRRDAAAMCAAPYRMGLTATPQRSDGLHTDLDWLIGPNVYTMPLDLARGSTLADYDVVRIPVYLQAAEQRQYDELSDTVRRYMMERRKEDPEFTWQDLCADAAANPEARRAQRAFHRKKAVEDRAREKLRVLEDIFRLHAGSRIIVFAGSNAMAREVSTRFLVPCLLNHCRKRERLDILQGLQDGTYPAIVANQVLDEGVDLPEAKVAVVIGGMASTRQATQRLGRVLRRSGNQRATLYEVLCADTGEEQRSRTRRRSDAYKDTVHVDTVRESVGEYITRKSGRR